MAVSLRAGLGSAGALVLAIPGLLAPSAVHSPGSRKTAEKRHSLLRFGFGPSFYRLEIVVLGNQQSMRHTMTALVTKSSAYPQFLSLYVDDLIVLNSIKTMYPAVIFSTKARGIGLDVRRNFRQ